MARYYFDLRDGPAVFPDEEGLDLPNARSAELEAARALGGMIRDLQPTSEQRDLAIEVRNEEGPLFQAALVFGINKLKN